MKMSNIKYISNFIFITNNKSICKLLPYHNRLNNYSSFTYIVNNIKQVIHPVKNCTPKKIIVNDLVTKYFSTTELTFGKSKDRGGKEKKKPKASASASAKVDLRELSEIFDVENYIQQMESSIENMKTDFMKNLMIRSTSGSIDQIPVSLDGKDYELQELAQIARKPKLIVLNVGAFPTAIPHIIKAIEKSGLNINPQQEGTTIYLPLPKVTKEHRENLSKNAKAIFIRYRDEIKDIRNKAIKKLKKEKENEDTLRRAQSQLEVLCDKTLKEAEKILDTKQTELLGSSD